MSEARIGAEERERMARMLDDLAGGVMLNRGMRLSHIAGVMFAADMIRRAPDGTQPPPVAMDAGER